MFITAGQCNLHQHPGNEAQGISASRILGHMSVNVNKSVIKNTTVQMCEDICTPHVPRVEVQVHLSDIFIFLRLSNKLNFSRQTGLHESLGWIYIRLYLDLIHAYSTFNFLYSLRKCGYQETTTCCYGCVGVQQQKGPMLKRHSALRK